MGATMSKEIDIDLEKEIANFYQSLGINQGPGDLQYRIILKLLKKNNSEVTSFSEIRSYTDHFADRGAIGSKMKTVFQLKGLVNKVEWGSYKITDKGIMASEFLDKTTEFYKNNKQYKDVLDRIP